jgi:hypothetical protein
VQEHQYRLWRFGAQKLLVRCREHALLPSHTPGAAPCSAVVRAKLEYAPSLGWEVRRCTQRLLYVTVAERVLHAHADRLQEVTAHERARWWSSLLLRPDAALVVYRVGVVDAALLAVERKDMAAVLDDSTEPGTRFKVCARHTYAHTVHACGGTCHKLWLVARWEMPCRR